LKLQHAGQSALPLRLVQMTAVPLSGVKLPFAAMGYFSTRKVFMMKKADYLRSGILRT
jgi:hypothetical protein